MHIRFWRGSCKVTIEKQANILTTRSESVLYHANIYLVLVRYIFSPKWVEKYNILWPDSVSFLK